MTRRRNRRARRSAAELELQAVVHRDIKPDNAPMPREVEEAGWIRTWSDAIAGLEFSGSRRKL